MSPDALVGIYAGITPADAGKTVNRTQQPGVEEDHPRGCGENVGITFVGNLWEGSPPRMRGKHCDEEAVRMRDRITPAYAGKTHIPSIFREIFQDHPRVCGENLTIAALALIGDGSPPRMRGKQILHNEQKQLLRITPAYAGKTA